MISSEYGHEKNGRDCQIEPADPQQRVFPRGCVSRK
jgi:hypothetical protein